MLSFEEATAVCSHNPETGIIIWKNKGKFHKYLNGSEVGSLDGDGYLRTKINGHRVGVHQLMCLLSYGYFPTEEIDHINHNRSDNRLSNLRFVRGSENQRNKSKQKNNTSGVVGVSWCKGNKRWHAQIYLDNRKKHLGSFVSFSDAVDARKDAEILYGFHENHGKDL